MIALRKSRLTELAESGHKAARAVMALREAPDRFLATVQIGITVVSATAAAFGGAAIAVRIQPVLAAIPGLTSYAEELSFALVVASVSYLSIVVGELVPKSLALRGAETYALVVARPLLALSWAARPLVWGLTASSNLLLKPFGDKTNFAEAKFSPEELQQMVEEAAQAGTVHKEAGEIVSRALDFAQLIAGEVMVPRSRVVMLPLNASVADLNQIIADHNHNRVPVYEDKVDNVVGYVSMKDVFALALAQKPIELAKLLRPPVFVPESMAAIELLESMRRKRSPFIIVVDENGGFAGIVTMEDLVEELVGDIVSEHGGNVPEPIRAEADGASVVLGSVAIREVNRALSVDLPEDGEWTTIAGLALVKFGHIPVAGESVEIIPGVTVEVVDASPRRIRSLRIRKR